MAISISSGGAGGRPELFPHPEVVGSCGNGKGGSLQDPPLQLCYQALETAGGHGAVGAAPWAAHLRVVG